MKLLVDSFQNLLSHLRETVDREQYLKALGQILKSKLQDTCSLARIYEQGSSVLSKDAAIAYALYSLNTDSKASRKTKEKISQLETQLTPLEKNRADLIVKNFQSF